MGGVRILEPAVDLPVALAVASSQSGVEVGRVAAWGEVGLTGETASCAPGEIGAAARPGESVFSQILCPEPRLSVLGDALAAVGISPGTVHRENACCGELKHGPASTVRRRHRTSLWYR